MNIKNNLPLIFGISIPVLMIIFVAASIYVPQLYTKPEYDFLYLVGENYCYISNKNGQTYSVNSNIYSVQNSRLVKNVSDEAYQSCIARRMPELKIYLYEVSAEKSREVSFDYAKNLILNNSPKSPDGFEIVRGTGGGGLFPLFFYSNSDYNARYITKGNVSKKLNIQQDGYYGNFILLGWVIK